MALGTRTAGQDWTARQRGGGAGAGAGRALILAVFVISGAAGLVYQVVWGRELVLVFGNTSQAVSTIVTAFMAGLGLGSLAGGRVADRSRRPLRVYGLLELAIAALALVMPLAFTSLASLYGGAYGGLVDRPQLLALTRFGLAFTALAPVTFFMGMTLPVLSRHLVRALDETGARLSELYAANTLGAMAGTLVAGFVLIEFIGLRLTSLLAVCLNVLAGTIALTMARRPSVQASPSTLPNGRPPEAPSVQASAARPSTGAPATGTEDGDARPAVARFWTPRRLAVLGATFVSGFVALALEVLWTRMVAEGTGSSIYVFTTILAIFLAGIALGSAAYRRWGRPSLDRAGVLGLCLAGVGLAALVTVVLGSGALVSVPFAARAVLVLLPATTLMGYGFPLAGKLVNPSVERTGGSIGLLYFANTLGSILGSFAAAFVLAATLGTDASILLLGALDLVVGTALVITEPAWLGRAKRPAALALAAVAALALVASSLDLPITRTRTENELLAQGAPVRHTEDELATVDAVGGPVKRLLIGGVGMTSLTVDTQLMAHLPKALRPQARDFLVIAMGMGSTYRSGLRAGLRTDVVELSPSVPGMMPTFYDDAEQYLHHPDGRVIVTDGRNYVNLSHKRYDLITVDPAPPIESAGSVVLYTKEFVTRAKARLNPGGLMTLWMPYALPMEDFKTHARTFRSVFAHTSLVFAPGRHGLYMMGSDAPITFDAASIRQYVGNEQTMADLAKMPDVPTGVHSADDWVRVITAGEWLVDGRIDAFVGKGPLITDDRPRSEYFLWRRAGLADRRYISQQLLLDATGG